MKLRLLLNPDCDRACAGCCNKTIALNSLPICTDFTPYEEIMLTGGEPMLHPIPLMQTIRRIRASGTKARIFLYTARTVPEYALGAVLSHLDGLTITIHEPHDVEPFLAFARYAKLWKLTKNRSLRVNVFKPMALPDDEPSLDDWLIKANMEWIINSPLPKDEVLMRIDHGITRANMAHNLHWTGSDA